MALTGLSTEGVRAALYDLERLGVVSNDTAITAFVHLAVKRLSMKRLEQAAALETALITHMREPRPIRARETRHRCICESRRRCCGDQGLDEPLPEQLWRIVRGIANDGRGEDGAAGSLSVRKQDAETARITLQREWTALEETAELRRGAAGRLLEHLLACVPKGSRGTDQLAETTLRRSAAGDRVRHAVEEQVKHPTKLLDRALMWLHELEVIRLNKGLAVFRPAMTVRLENREKWGFTNTHFEPLALHYNGQVLQVHVMAAFAQHGLAGMRDALRLARDYFTLKESRPRPLAAGTGQEEEDRPPDHARFMAGHRRESGQPRAAQHRRRRPRPDQRAGAGRSRLGKDLGCWCTASPT